MDIKIRQMVYKGNGLANLEDGSIVFIPFTLPGETVTVESLYDRNGVRTAFPEKIVTTSSDRVTPECPYYGLCGGCQYQHINYPAQIEIKRAILVEQLERVGSLKNISVNPVVSSSRQFAYRNHVQFHLDPDGKPGFQKALSHDVIAIDKCLIVEEPINQLLKTIQFEPEAGIERVSVRDDGEGTPLLFLTGSSNNPPEFEVDFPLNVVYRSQAGDIVLSGGGSNQFSIRGKEFQVSAGSFFQTNNEIAEKMAEVVEQLAEITSSSLVLDCYCGVGFFSKFLAEKAERLIGIESSEDACNDFAVNLDEFDNVELYQGTAEVILPHLDIKPDLVVVDPPRAGIAPSAMKALMKSRPNQIIYVSCDPSTLARDLKILTASGYAIDSITPVDMFPQTYHIESITNLKRLM